MNTSHIILSFRRCFLLYVVCFTFVVGTPWSEDDERRRIAQIKAEERREFRMQMGGSNDGLYDDTESKKLGSDFYSAESYPAYRDLFKQQATQEPRPWRTAPPTTQPSAPEPQMLTLPDSNTSVNSSVVHWCFHCMSPLRVLSEPMQKAVHNLFDVRRSRLPTTAVVPDCSKPANIRTLPKQQCRLEACQTLILMEHERAATFTVRGCAENFAAVDDAVLDARGNNQCVRIHDRLDLRECVCKSRKYCYTGRDDSRIDAASEQAVSFHAKLTSGSDRNTGITVAMGFFVLLLPCLMPYR